MIPLDVILRDFIATQGPMPMADYMAICLYDPEHGYYTRGLNFVGEGPVRDFITAPEITPLFGATMANAVAAAWQRLGAPTPFVLAEAGPGRGTLMCAMLTHLQTAHPACMAAAQVVLVETSPALSAQQKETLNAFPLCQWQPELSSPATAPWPWVVVANELLDAFPAQPYRLHQGEWQKEHVTYTPAGDLALCWLPCPPPILPPVWSVEEGAMVELSPSRTAWLQGLQAHLAKRGGVAFLLDYGAATLPPQGAYTVQAMRGHTPVPVTSHPGDTDLTVHIPFDDVAHLLGPSACTLTDLAPFLLKHGLVDVALQAPQSEQNALQRLLHPAQMGTLFKVLCATYACPPHP